MSSYDRLVLCLRNLRDDSQEPSRDALLSELFCLYDENLKLEDDDVKKLEAIFSRCFGPNYDPYHRNAQFMTKIKQRGGPENRETLEKYQRKTDLAKSSAPKAK